MYILAIKKGFKQLIKSILLFLFDEITTKKIWYFIITGKKLDLENPKNLCDKICWLEFFWQDQRIVDLTDKYEVRSYVEKCGFQYILVPIIGIYNTVDEIPFGELPKSFVFKCTHGCGYNIICKNRHNLDWPKIKKKLNFWLKKSFGYYGLELHYNAIKPRILCEQYLEQINASSLIDYKIHCINGVPYFTLVCFDREKRLKLTCYDNDWKHLDYIIGPMKTEIQIPKPKRLVNMLKIARKLSEPFPFVRVDLYEIENKIYFGEMTFSPNMGMFTYYNEKMLEEYGKLLRLPEEKKMGIWHNQK